MIIELSQDIVTGIVRAWLKDNLKDWIHRLNHGCVHPEDIKVYKKDIKAARQLLEYIGEDT